MKAIHLKERRKKEVRALHKRLREIYALEQALGYRKLESPMRHGWYKEVILTVKLERYKSRPEIEELFDLMEHRFWGRTKKECDTQWNKQVSSNYIVKGLPSISKKQFNKLSRKAQKLCVPYICYRNRKKYTRFYVRFPKPSYQIKYTRAYVTHSKIIDPLLMSESDLIDQKMLKEGYFSIARKWRQDEWFNEYARKAEKRTTEKELRRYRNMDLKTITWERNSRGKI